MLESNLKLSKLLIVSLIFMFSLSLYTKVSSAASDGNWKDTLIEFKGSANQIYNGIGTPFREKTNATSCYAYNDKSNVNFSSVEVVVPGTNGSRFVVTYGKAKKLPIGEAYYFPNLAYEKGYRKAALEFFHSQRENVYYHIWWSPDSI